MTDASPNPEPSPPKKDPFINNRHTGGTKGRRGPSRLLRDLRHVYTKDETEDRTRAQATLRKIYKEDPAGFMDRLQRAEADHRRLASKAVTSDSTSKNGDSAESDLGTARCIELCEKLLATEGWKTS